MSINIKYLGHSAFIISYNNSIIAIDPFITGNPLASNVSVLEKLTDILVTHGHGDHLGDSLRLSKKYNAPITTIFELANYCLKKGVKANGINIGGKVNFDWGYANWVPASHSSSTPDGQYAGVASGIILNINGKTIYHAGDTGLQYEFKMIGEFYKPDIAFLPIGGHYTMGQEEAVTATNWLRCKTVIPMHYNTFDVINSNENEFQNLIHSSTQAKCIILKPNEIYNVK